MSNSNTLKNRVRCPSCHSSNCLWESVDVPAWRAINEHGEPTGGMGHGIDREAMWSDAEPNGDVGCGECSWEGRRADLERLDMDGNVLVPVHPGQSSLLSEHSIEEEER